MSAILRAWTFWIRTVVEAGCRAYLETVKLQEMRATAGNHRAAALFRDREDGTTVVVVMSIWDSMDSVHALGGNDHEAPSIDPADPVKIFNLEPKVRHYRMSDAAARALIPRECRDLREGDARRDRITTPAGLRDRALIESVVYTSRTWARRSARIEDVYVQGLRTWARLHEQGARSARCPANVSSTNTCTRISASRDWTSTGRRFCSARPSGEEGSYRCCR
jgi:hypothetical protein